MAVTLESYVPLFTESSSVLSQRGQKHDGVAMLMTSNHPRTFLPAPGKSRSHVLPRFAAFPTCEAFCSRVFLLHYTSGIIVFARSVYNINDVKVTS